MSTRDEALARWDHWHDSDKRAEEAMRAARRLDPEEWGALVEFHLTERYGRVPTAHELKYVTARLGWDKADGPPNGYTRASASEVADTLGETWREMRGIHIPPPPPEPDEHGDFLGSALDDLSAMQARAGWAPAYASREVWEERHGKADDEALGSALADLEQMQRESG